MCLQNFSLPIRHSWIPVKMCTCWGRWFFLGSFFGDLLSQTSNGDIYLWLIPALFNASYLLTDPSQLSHLLDHRAGYLAPCPHAAAVRWPWFIDIISWSHGIIWGLLHGMCSEQHLDNKCVVFAPILVTIIFIANLSVFFCICTGCLLHTIQMGQRALFPNSTVHPHFASAENVCLGCLTNLLI